MMETITIRFTTKYPPNIGSWIVARLGGSPVFSHCMAIIDGMAFEATMLDGCRVINLADAMHGVTYYQDMIVPVNSVRSGLQFGWDQRGKSYDFLGALGIPFLASDDWADDSKWWCSELNFMMLGAAGNWVLDKEIQKRVTPEHLRMLDYPKTEIRFYPREIALTKE